MKSCPTCNRTFEDTFTFCLIDGAVLSAPYDPHATLIIPEPRNTEPPPTQVLKAEAETIQEISLTIASSNADQNPEASVSTIAAPAPTFKESRSEASPVGRKSNRRVWIIAGTIVVLIISAAIAYKYWKTAYRHYLAGYEFLSQQKYPEAEAQYRESVRLEPENPMYHYWLAKALSLQQRYPEAEAELREIVRLRPNERSSHDDLAQLFEEQKKYAEAEQGRRESLRITMNDVRKKDFIHFARFFLGLNLEKQKKYAEAAAEFREAVRLEPDDSTYQESLRRVLEAQERLP